MEEEFKVGDKVLFNGASGYHWSANIPGIAYEECYGLITRVDSEGYYCVIVTHIPTGRTDVLNYIPEYNWRFNHDHLCKTTDEEIVAMCRKLVKETQKEPVQKPSFDSIVNTRIEKIKTVLGEKAKEYAVNGDRLHNFRRAAQVGNTTPAVALKGMLMKHLVCVLDMLDGNMQPTEYLISEKIGDIINYLILAEALLNESVLQKECKA